MEKGLKTLHTASRAARKNDQPKQATPSVSHRSGSEFEDSGLQIDGSRSSASPANATSTGIAPGPLPHLSYGPSYSASGRKPSITSIASLSAPSSGTPVHPMPASNPSNAFYPQALIQPSFYSSAPSTAPAYTHSVFGNPNSSPTGIGAYTQPSQGLPPINQSLPETSLSRTLHGHALPPPSILLATSRAHREPITASY
jgi:hypothetical protein